MKDIAHCKAGRGPFAGALERCKQLHYHVLRKWVHRQVLFSFMSSAKVLKEEHICCFLCYVKLSRLINATQVQDPFKRAQER